MAGARCYYRTPFKGHQGFSQGYPLSPTILNMVADVFISHLVTLVGIDEAGLYIFVQDIKWMAALFYTDDSLLASTRPDRI